MSVRLNAALERASQWELAAFGKWTGAGSALILLFTAYWMRGLQKADHSRFVGMNSIHPTQKSLQGAARHPVEKACCSTVEIAGTNTQTAHLIALLHNTENQEQWQGH